MTRKSITIILILFASFQNLTLNAQCVCTAGELIDLSISQDSYCSSDSLRGIMNHATISVTRANLKTGTFQWAFKSQLSGSNWSALSPSWTGTIDIDNTSLYQHHNGEYRCIFTEIGTNCRDTIIVSLIVQPQPYIYVTNDSTTCDGMWFSVHDYNNLSGVGNNYCWQFNGVDCASTDSTYLFDQAGCMMVLGNVNVIVNSGAECFDERRLSGICNNDFLNVTQVIHGDPGFCIGSTTTFLTIERNPLLNIPANWQYQWKRNGFQILAANSVSFYPKKSGNYTCVVTNASGCTKETNAIEITVYPAADVQIQSVANTEICMGDSLLLQAISTNSTDFLWYRNGISTGIMGNDFFAKQGGIYKVLASTQLGGCEKFSNRITTTVFRSNATAVGSSNICKNDSVMLQATSNGQPIQYQWIRYSKVIPGANTDQLFASKKGRYRVVITSSENCMDTSNSIFVTSNCRIADFTNNNSEQVNIYPNPTSGTFEIKIEEIHLKTDKSALLQYSDPIGKILHTTTILFDDNGIAMCQAPTFLAKGMYILLIQYGELNFESKIILLP